MLPMVLYSWTISSWFRNPSSSILLVYLLTHSRSWLRGLKCWRPIMIVITRLLLFQRLRKTFLAKGWKFSHWPLCRIWPLFKRLKQYEHYYCYLNWQYNTQLTSTVNDILFNTSAIIQITKIKDTPCISISLNQEALISFDYWNFSKLLCILIRQILPIHVQRKFLQCYSN